ncbi:MAG: arsenic transporter, partial [Acidimicrobiia bacterium]
PALLVGLPALDAHPDRLWAVLMGVNLGPTLWVTGALSTLLWQSSMARLGHRVTARTYARYGARVGLPVLAAVAATRAAQLWFG